MSDFFLLFLFLSFSLACLVGMLHLMNLGVLISGIHSCTIARREGRSNNRINSLTYLHHNHSSSPLYLSSEAPPSSPGGVAGQGLLRDSRCADTQGDMKDWLRYTWHASRVEGREAFSGSTSTKDIGDLRMTGATLIHGVHAIDANHLARHVAGSLKCNI